MLELLLLRSSKLVLKLLVFVDFRVVVGGKNSKLAMVNNFQFSRHKVSRNLTSAKVISVVLQYLRVALFVVTTIEANLV